MKENNRVIHELQNRHQQSHSYNVILLSLHQWALSFLDVVHMESSSARIHGAVRLSNDIAAELK